MFALALRPTKLGDFIGQRHLLGDGKPISNMLKNGQIFHTIFYGPPGVGKTTLARILASELHYEFLEFNATSLKIDALRQSVAKYKNSLLKALVFIDEIHRLNKAQQEVLLPIMENFEAIILGASTYNPYFALTDAIRSRTILLEFKPLSRADMEAILERATRAYGLNISADSKRHIIDSGGGDARAMLNLVEIAGDNDELLREISPYRRGASEDSTHYDLISALIKSIRGSDENAAIYYLARLISAGENPEFIARRLVILASEDIGNANPNALNLATSAMLAVAKIGYPESRIILSQCALYLAASPKSNTAYKAINKALDFVDKGESLPVPSHIRQFHKGYKYPHDFGGWVAQEYLPMKADFVEWSDVGFEKTLQEWLTKIRRRG